MSIIIDQTIERLETRIKDNPKSLVFARLADLYLEQGRIDEAINLCTESSKFHPYYVTGYFVLAKAYIAQKDLEKAETALKKVLSHDQQYPAAHKLLGDILCKTNRDSLAIAHYEDVLFMDPLEEKVRKALARIPKQTVKPVPKPEETAKPEEWISESVGESKFDSKTEFQDESWMDQIKEFHPEGKNKPAGGKEKTLSPDKENQKYFSEFKLSDEKEKPILPAETPVWDRGTDETPDLESNERPSAEASSPPPDETLIGERLFDFPEIMPQIPQSSPTPEPAFDTIPGLSQKEPPASSFEMPIAEQAKPFDPFPSDETETILPSRAPKIESTGFPPPLNEPTMLNETPVSSEPVIFDETVVSSELDIPIEMKNSATKADEPASKDIESDFSSLFVEPEAPRPTRLSAPSPEPREAGTVPEKPAPREPVGTTEEKKMPKIVTPTLGEIYAAQGQHEKAIKVYETLLEKNPAEKKYLDKIEEMKKKLKESLGK